MRNNYIAVTTKFICSFKEPLPFDVFIERSDGKFTTIYKKNSTHDEQQIARYQEKNLKFLYVDISEKDILESFIINIRNSNVFETEQMIEIYRMGLTLTFDYQDFPNEELITNLDLATHNVNNSIKLLENDVHMAMEIFKALSENTYLLRHSYMVSLFSIVLAKKLGMSTNKILLSIGLGAFLHDIGHTRLKPNLFVKNHLTNAEWLEIKDHPQLALRILDTNSALNTEVRSIIIQHHEQFNGRGYPNRLHNNQIFPPAKIVAIADGFCALVAKTSYRNTYKTPEAAIQVMRDDLGHYDPEYLETFTDIVLKRN